MNNISPLTDQGVGSSNLLTHVLLTKKTGFISCLFLLMKRRGRRELGVQSLPCFGRLRPRSTGPCQPSHVRWEITMKDKNWVLKGDLAVRD